MEQATETTLASFCERPRQAEGTWLGMGVRMLPGGPAHWSNKRVLASALHVALAGVTRLRGRFTRCVFVAVVGGVALVAEQVSAHAQLAQQPTVTVASVLRAEPASRVRLSIQVGPSGALPKSSFIRIRGLPPAAALTEGHVIAAGTWAVPLAALPALTIVLPASQQGESRIAIILVSVDGEVLAETTMLLTVSAPEPTTPEPVPRQLAQPSARLGAAPLPKSSAEREQALGLHAKGLEQLERGNVFAARKFFERGTEAGLAQSAVALASTFDPNELVKIRVIGLQPNIDEARKWYERARELGALEAVERLQRLGSR